jgi:hypothetical protein
MVGVKFFLDTNVLMCLDGLEDLDLQDFRTRIEESNSELCTTHVPMDEWRLREKEQEYPQEIKKVLKSLKNKGINVTLEDAKTTICGPSRSGYAVVGSEEEYELEDDLKEEIDKCQKDKGSPRPLSNILSDANIAVSSLGHDFFITCDRCLSESWKKVIGKHSVLKQRYKFPRVIYTRPIPKAVAKEIMKVIP